MLNFSEINCKWWILLAMSSALALVYIDQTAPAVALPAIQRDLNLSNNLIHWVVNAYLLAISALILLGGKMGDIQGHKRTFLFGVVTFLVASIFCALCKSVVWMICARALQGLGGAFLIPSINALMVDAFPKEKLGKMMGICVGIAAIFLSLGPLIGGALTQGFGWRAVFWINVPVALFSITVAAVAVPNRKPAKKMALDYLGTLLSALFISGFVLMFMEGSNWGWSSPAILILFALSLISFITFIYWQRQFTSPLIELQLFKNPIFSIIIIVVFMIQAVMMVFVFWAIFIQNILQYSPLNTGLLLIPSVIPAIFMSPVAGHLRDKYGPGLPMLWGSILLILSLVWIGLFSHYQKYIWLFPGFLVHGISIPLILSGSVTTAMSIVNTQQRGMVSAIVNCARQFGSSIGLAILGSFLTTLNKWKLISSIKHTPILLPTTPKNLIDHLLVKSTLVMQAIRHLQPEYVKLLMRTAVKAYTFAFSMSMFLAAIFTFLCMLLIIKLRVHVKKLT